MADVKKETILLEIDTTFGDSIQQMSTLKSRIDALKDANRDLEKENKKLRDGIKEDISLREKNERLIQLNNEEITKNATVIRNLTERQREHGKTVENEIKMRQNEEGSIKQMRLQLIELRKNYESLSKTEREGLGGQNMLKDIERQTKALKTLEAQQLDFRRNVGNYADALLNVDPAIAKLLKGFKELSGGTMNVGVAAKNAIPFLKALGAELKALVMNPVGAVIMGLVVAFKAIKEAIERNDDALTELQMAFKALAPFAEAFRTVMDGIAFVFVKVASGVSAVVTGILSLIPAFKQSSDAAKDYVKQMDALEELERQYAVETAKNEAEIAELRAKAAQKTKYSAQERKRMLEEAGRLEKENLKMQLETAQEELRLAEDEARRRHDTSDDTKKRLSELQANVWRAVKTYNEGMRSIQRATQSAIAEIDKLASKDITLPQFKKQKQALQQRVADLREAYQQAMTPVQNALGQWVYNFIGADEIKKELDEAEQTLENFSQFEETAQSNSDKLQQIAEDYRKKELEANRAYEDAVIEMMDDGLDKQLALIDTEYEREIEDLRHKLQTEEHLTVEARNKINQLIQLKEKQWNEQRIVTEAKYWGETRELARQSMREISRIMQDTMTDPNNILGGFTVAIHNELTGITDEFEEASDSLLDFFGKQYEQLVFMVNKALKDTDLSKELTPNVIEVLTAITNKTDEFSNNATKSLDSFILALETMQARLRMTPDEIAIMRDAVKPIMDNINRYYNAMAELPSRYMEKLSNTMYNKMVGEAKKMREVVMKTFEFKALDDEQVKNFTRDINIMDGVLQRALSAWQYRIDNEIGFKIDDPLNINYIDWDKEKAELDEKLQGVFGDRQEDLGMKVRVNWNIETDDENLKNRISAMAAKYGDIIDTSFTGILAQITGTDDVAEQLDWLLKNYNEAIQKVRQMNDDMWEAYSMSGEDAFYNAIPDTSTIIQGLQQLYNTYVQFTKTGSDYDKERLEIQNKYLENGGSEVAMQNELLEVNKKEYEQRKSVAEQQKAYIESIRDEVGELEVVYNKVNAENTQQIKTLETQLQILHDEAATIDKSTPDGEAKLEENRAKAEQIRSQIATLQTEIETALANLVATGFTSVGQIDEEVQKLVKTILQAQNGILETTATQTSNWSRMWLTTFTGITSGIGGVAGAFQSLFDEMGEGNEKMGEFAAQAAYFQIGMSLAEGIASAVAKGMEMGWPAAAIMIPTGISLVVSAIAEAMGVWRQYKAPKYAKGGYVSGEKGVDKIPAWLSDGEYVIKRKRVKELGVPFLDALNEGKSVMGRRKFAEGGLVTTEIANNQMNMDATREMLVEAMSEISPIVSVMEITKAQNRVKIAERNSKR